MLHNLLNVLMLLLIQKKIGGGGWFSLLFNSTNKLIQFKHGRLQSFDRPQQSLFTIYNFYLQFLYNYIYCSWIFFLKVYQKLRILKARAIWNALILIFLDVFSLQNSTSDVTASTYYRGPWSPNCGPSSGAATTATTGRWSTRDAPWVSVSVCLSVHWAVICKWTRKYIYSPSCHAFSASLEIWPRTPPAALWRTLTWTRSWNTSPGLDPKIKEAGQTTTSSSYNCVYPLVNLWMSSYATCIFLLRPGPF